MSQNKGNDFLAAIDADPASETYGSLITSLVTDQQTVSLHYTEYVMPASGMLFANDHDARGTLRDPGITHEATCQAIVYCGVIDGWAVTQ
jgi:hypothetical protein